MDRLQQQAPVRLTRDCRRTRIPSGEQRGERVEPQPPLGPGGMALQAMVVEERADARLEERLIGGTCLSRDGLIAARRSDRRNERDHRHRGPGQRGVTDRWL